MKPNKASPSSKPGCKGDPRMNRALQARLSNPDMPLFHALRFGGFNFPANEDASTLDNDQVTLGQRKNQLLRRLRQFARKHETEAKKLDADSTQGVHQHRQQYQLQQPAQGQQLPNPLCEAFSAAPGALLQFYQMQEVSGGKRPALSPPRISGESEKVDSIPAQSRMRMATHQLQQQPADYLRATITQGQFELGQADRQQHFSPHTMGRMINELGVLPNNSNQRTSQQGNASFSDGKSLYPSTNPVASQLHPPSSLVSGAILGGASIYPSSMQTNTTVCPGAATASVDSPFLQHAVTAAHSGTHHTGTTQEQQLLSSSSSASHTNPELQAKEAVALRLFQEELQTLYCRSMLAAGYSTEDTAQKSCNFRRFAFHAWKQECERLQNILGEREVDGLLPGTGSTL